MNTYSAKFTHKTKGNSFFDICRPDELKAFTKAFTIEILGEYGSFEEAIKANEEHEKIAKRSL